MILLGAVLASLGAGGAYRDRVLGLEVASAPSVSAFDGLAWGSLPGLFRAVIRHGPDYGGAMALIVAGGSVTLWALMHGRPRAVRAVPGIAFTGLPRAARACGRIAYPVRDRLGAVTVSGRPAALEGLFRGRLTQLWVARGGRCLPYAALLFGTLELDPLPARGGARRA
jgi:hypothetical protein